jgi:hypothetical protein
MPYLEKLAAAIVPGWYQQRVLRQRMRQRRLDAIRRVAALQRYRPTDWSKFA